MIQETELRIGNWIESYKRHHKVRGLSSGSTIRTEEGEWLAPVFCNGIPLSPELLEKAGFVLCERNEDGDLWRNGKFTVIHTHTIDVGESNTIEIIRVRAFFLHGYHNDCHIRYLHQLQNLFYSLTGEELSLHL